jgi:hypothetical protein
MYAQRLTVVQPLYSTATVVESVHSDADHHALRDRCLRSIGFIWIFNGLSDACLHHSVAGSSNLFRSRPPDRQVWVGSPLRWRSGFIYAVPSDSVFLRTHVHTRHGDSGAVCGFASDLWKFCCSVGTEAPYRKVAIIRHSPLNHRRT